MPNTDNSNANIGVGGTSYLYDYGTSPNTRTAVSQKVRILTPHMGNTSTMAQMGVLSQFNPSQSRTVEPVRGIGFGDQVAELVPSVTEPTTGNFERALLYLCNLWQATGYASGIDGPVRSLSHHKWPFDIEQQVVFSTLADVDMGVPNEGVGFDPGTYNGGVSQVVYGDVTPNQEGTPKDESQRGHSAIITVYEACWFTSWSTTFAKDSGLIMESGDVTVSDVHDFASVYGEFLATGNDPTIGQLGSVRYAESGYDIAGAAGRQTVGAAGQGVFAVGAT